MNILIDTPKIFSNSENPRKKMLISKLIALVIIAPVLLISVIAISIVCHERVMLKDNVEREVSSKWGGYQTLGAPFVICVEHKKDDKGKPYEMYRKYFPSNFDAQAKLIPEIRHRGIYEVALYNAEVSAKTTNSAIEIKEDCEYYIAFSITDVQGMNSIDATLNGEPLNFFLARKDSFFKAKISPEKIKKDFNVDLNLKLRGFKSFLFEAVANSNKFKIYSDWDSPSFSGSSLPNKKEITDKSFTGEWEITSFFPKSADNAEFTPAERYVYNNSNSKTAGVEIFVPTDTYSQFQRAIAYSFLFIAIFLISLLVAELATGVVSHAIQFIVSALVPAVFYLLLLSTSEFLGFNHAFLASAILATLMISTYVKFVYSSSKAALAIFAANAVSYAITFTLLKLENTALLIGSFVVFAIVAILMFITASLNKDSQKENE